MYKCMNRSSNMVYTFSDIGKNHQVRKKYTIQLGENELVLKVSVSLFLIYLFPFFFFLRFCLFSGKAKENERK